MATVTERAKAYALKRGQEYAAKNGLEVPPDIQAQLAAGQAPRGPATVPGAAQPGVTPPPQTTPYNDFSCSEMERRIYVLTGMALVLVIVAIYGNSVVIYLVNEYDLDKVNNSNKALWDAAVAMLVIMVLALVVFLVFCYVRGQIFVREYITKKAASYASNK